MTIGILQNYITEQGRVGETLELGPQAFSNQRQQFWTLQIAGWLGYAIVVYLAIIQPQSSRPDFNQSGQIINLLIETLTGFSFSYLQWKLIQKIVHLPLKRTLVLSFSSATFLGILYNIIKLSSYKVVVYHQQWNESWNMLEFGGWLLFSLTTMLVWTAIFFIMLYNTRLQKEHEKLLRVQTEAKEAQLQMLRYQLNPHFMFNTMNAISTLIYKHENDRANDMLDKLCEFFRYTLDRSERIKATLQKEFELLDLYLSIEKARFGERLQVELKLDETVADCLVPYMLLQPIVENAIKYAIEPSKTGGSISIAASKQNNRLYLVITDSGPKRPGPVREGLGIGMTNTNARLDTMYDGDYSVDIDECENEGTRVTINLPIRK